MYNVQIAPLERWIITTIKSSEVIWLYFNLEKNDLEGCDWFLIGYVRPGFDSFVWVIELCPRPSPHCFHPLRFIRWTVWTQSEDEWKKIFQFIVD